MVQVMLVLMFRVRLQTIILGLSARMETPGDEISSAEIALITPHPPTTPNHDPMVCTLMDETKTNPSIAKGGGATARTDVC